MNEVWEWITWYLIFFLNSCLSYEIGSILSLGDPLTSIFIMYLGVASLHRQLVYLSFEKNRNELE